MSIITKKEFWKRIKNGCDHNKMECITVKNLSCYICPYEVHNKCILKDNISYKYVKSPKDYKIRKYNKFKLEYKKYLLKEIIK